MAFFADKQARAFYAIEEFPQLLWLTKQYTIILEELKQNRLWMHWGSDDYDPSGHCQFLSGDWTVCPIYFGKMDPYQMNVPGMDKGQVNQMLDSLPKRYPKTIEVLKNISTLRFSAFSRLHPKSKLAPHKHQNPFGLIFHLGLIIPPGCGLTVGGETYLWTKPGDAVIFDDNFEHSAWNESAEERIVLYIDFERTTFI